MADTTVAIPNDQQPKDKSTIEKESDKSPTEDEEEEDEDEEEEEEEVHDTERVIRTLPKDHSSDVSDSVDDLIQKKVERGAEDDDDRANDAKSEDEASTGESEAGTESLSKNTQQMTSNRDYDKDEMKCEEEMETESTHNSSVCDSKEKSSSPFARSSVATDRGVSSSRTDDTMDVEIRGLNDQFGSSRTLKEQLESRMDSWKNKERERKKSIYKISKEAKTNESKESDISASLSDVRGVDRTDEMELRTAFRESKKRKIRDLAKRKDVEDRSDDDDSNPHEGSQRHTKSNVEISPVVVQVCTVLQNDNSKRSTRNLCETKRNTSVDQNDTEDEESKSGPDATLKNSNVDNLDECEEVNNENNTSSFKEVEKILNRKKSSKESKSEFCKKLPDSYDVDNRGPNEESGNEQENLIKQEKGDIMEEKETVDKVRTKRKKLKEKSKYQKMAIKSEKLLENDETEMPTLAILDVRTVVDDDSNSLSSTNTTIKGAVVEKERSEDASNEDSNGSNKSSTPNKTARESSDKPSGIEAIANKLTKKNKQATEDNEMKNYAADTMNELLGLFGYEKVDESTKDSIQLSNNLSGPSKSKSDRSSLPVGEGDEPGSQSTETAVSTPLESLAVADKNPTPEKDNEEEVKKEESERKEVTSIKKGEKVISGGSAIKTVQGRTCSVCGKTKSCKYQVLMLGTTKFLCDDNCFREFRTKQNITTAPAIKDIIAENRPITRSLTNPKDHCNVCHKEIKNGMGLLPGVGENKPLCSEECMKNYHATQGLKRGCAQCGNHIQSRSKCLTWEAMEFCNEECLGKYQSYLGSHCAYCNNAVQQTSLGKYCVRFGSDIKQFCSNSCLEEFKKGLKVCSYCQKDISNGSEGFLAPVGDKGQFKEFCSQSCMEKYETMGSVTPSQPSIEQCSVCNKVTSVKVEVTFEGKVHKLCSEPCIAAFRYANKINTSICDTCHKFFDLDVTRQLTIQFEGSSKRFCTKACMNVFVLYHRKVVPCSWCKVKKYNFDMIERVDSNNHVQLFCSLNCLSLFRVSLNATSSRRIQCDFCHQVKPAQYHLTMSDASIRNFCSYNCVMQFQSQFTSVAPVITPQQATRTTTTTSTTQSSTPVISSVMSLAPSQILSQPQQQQPSQQGTPTAQKAVVVRPQGLPVIPTVKNVVHKTISTQTLTPIITQQVIIKHPPAKPQKNKMLTCKPIVQTKGVSCKPHPCHKTTQTEEDCSKPVIIPIPVPIFVPVPMRMYTTPVPFPLPFPLPIPVPIFIPTTKNSAHGIFKQIKEIQQKIPDNPFEADLILMAEMVAEDSSSGKDKNLKQLTDAKHGDTSSQGQQQQEHESSSTAPDESPKQEEGFVVETSLPDSCPTPNAFGDAVLQMALRMASGMEEPVDLESALTSSETSLSQDANAVEENGSYLRSQGRNQKRSNSRGRGRGRKRARTDEGPLDQSIGTETASSTPQAQPPPPTTTPPVPSLATQFDFRPIGPPQLESNCVLKYSYGVNAWKHWVLQKNTQLEKASQTNRKLKLFKTDILQLTADELNYSLCLFVKEVRKPNGDEYAPDSIYYLCLGIQQYLFENGRIDNIFSDAYYEKFTECLNEVLQRYEGTMTSDGCFLSRIEEEILWECKQLGAHSPHVLLNTLMYFNTKYFILKTVEDHLQLSFSHILKHWKKSPGSTGKGNVGGRNVLLRYYPPSQIKDSSRRRKEAIPAFEQVENLENPLRCPVKLYEFYLSKCPESIKNRNDIFYLYPERSCVPDSPVWYSTMSLGKETIAKMLQRIRMVREVGEAIAGNS